MLGLILIFSFLGSVGALLVSALFLLFPVGIRQRLVPNLISYATGTLLGAAFLGMIPAGLQKAVPFQISVVLLLGILLFFLLEKLVLWRHSHDDQGGLGEDRGYNEKQSDRGVGPWRPVSTQW